DDPDYFLVLIQLAYYDQEFEKVDKQRGQSIPYMNWKLFTQTIGGHYGREITRQIQSGHKGNRG
ncbi:MAG: hypothetical protein NTY86_23245, partial [Deltaproteobacteria bacterium]|nr:hypothetical protein [Deltaproteobacteria bacterium]